MTRAGQLVESENFFRTIFENSGIAGFVCGEDNIISLVNTEFESFFRYARDEVEGKKGWIDLIQEKDFERLMRYHRMRGISPQVPPKSYEVEVIDRYGHIRNTYVTVTLIPETKQRVVSFLDISTLKKNEIALREGQTNYRALFDNSGLAIVHIDARGSHLSFNDYFADFIGYSRRELESMTAAEFIHPDSFERVNDLGVKQVAGQIDCFTIDIRFIRKGNSIRWGKVRAIPLRDEQEKFLSAILVIIDKTAQRQIEENLLARENELRIKERKLGEAYTTLKFLMEAMETDQEELKEMFLTNIREQALPFLDQLKKTPMSDIQKSLIKMIETSLEEIASPFIRNLASSYLSLTKKEIQISALIKEGKTSKEISEFLNITQRAVDYHRGKIRDKLGLKNKRSNLQMLLHNYDTPRTENRKLGYLTTSRPLAEARNCNHKSVETSFGLQEKVVLDALKTPDLFPDRHKKTRNGRDKSGAEVRRNISHLRVDIGRLKKIYDVPVDEKIR